MRGVTACMTIVAVVVAHAPATGHAMIGPPGPPGPPGSSPSASDPPSQPGAPIEIDWDEDRRTRSEAIEYADADSPEGRAAERTASAAPLPETTDPLPETTLPETTLPETTASTRPGRTVPPPTVAAAEAAAAPMLVAIGLGADAPGSREEWAILDRLEHGLLASTEPRAELRRLRTPISAPRRVCRDSGAVLVISVSYVAQRLDPLLAAWDCELDLELGRWAAGEAASPELLASIWREHDEAIASGEAIAGARGRPKLPPKVRTGLVVGGVVLALGATLAILLAAGLREDRVVLTVRP